MDIAVLKPRASGDQAPGEALSIAPAARKGVAGYHVMSCDVCVCVCDMMSCGVMIDACV